MSNFVVDRILSQKNQIIKPQEKIAHSDEEEVLEELVDNSPIVSPEELRIKLEEKLNPKPKIIMNQDTTDFKIELVHFSSLLEFVAWYEGNKGAFSEKQIAPLDTLIEARNITIGGCNCDREKRRFIAEDYFRKFWSQNKTTDLLPTLQKALKTKKIIFGDFLAFPE